MDELIFKLNGVQLVYSPDGWDDSIIKRGRHDTYFSLKSQFTTQLSFVKDGADILKNIFNSQGFEGVCELKIEQLDPNTWTYYNIFTGNLDFSTYFFEEPFVKISSAEDSFWEMIKANEKTEYEIDIDSNNPISIGCEMSGIRGSAFFKILAANYTAGQAIAGVTLIEENSINNEISTNNVIKTGYANPPNHSIGDSLLIINQPLNTLNVWLNLNGTVSGTGTVKFYLRTYDNVLLHYLLLQITAHGGVINFNNYFLQEVIYSGNTGGNQALFLDIEVTTGVALYLNNSTIYFTYFTLISKVIKALRPITILNQLLTNMNDNVSIPIKYNAFMGILSDYLLTSGDAVRGLSNSKIKTSFFDFFDWCNKTFSLGFGFENNQVILNYKSYFFQDIEVANFEEVGNLKLEVYKTHIINNLKIGYDEQTYDNVNGRYEVNQTQQWTFPIKKIAKQGDYVSKYRADALGIIFTSLNLEGKITVDGDEDNDIFVIHTKTTSGVTILNRDYIIADYDYPVSGIGGVSFQQNVIGAFNVNLTPKRNLLRQGAFLNSFLHNIIGEIKFESATKNSRFRSKLIGETVLLYENDPILINSLPSRLFLPYICTVKAIIEKDLNILLLQNPNGYISFIYKGNVFKGFINELGINPGKKTEYEVKLIMHPDTDLTLLI